MRRVTLSLVLALTLVPAAARGQDSEEDPNALPTTRLTFDLGARYSYVDGDDARFERYRDMSNGLFLPSLRLETERHGWFLETSAANLGRRDQRLAGEASLPGRLTLSGMWDRIPMVMSRTTRTLFEPGPLGVLSIDDRLQGDTNALAGALTTARLFELGSRRQILEGNLEWLATPAVTVNANVRHTDREGTIPFGGGFGHSNVVETLAPVEHRLTNVDTSLEYAAGDLLLRGGYTGSWFSNELGSYIFDNPFQDTDLQGIGSRGQMALVPRSSYIGVNGTISYRLPRRTRVTAYFSKALLQDYGDPIVPFTVNTALPSVPLDRNVLNGEAGTSAANITFTSRPTRMLNIDLRFRRYDYDNRTAVFTVTERVAYDNRVSAIDPPAHTEGYGLTRETFDASVRVSPNLPVAAGIGYGYRNEDRTHRIFESTEENVLRLTADSVGNGWLTLRTKYEYAQRRGKGDPERLLEILESVEEQPGMRHFDIASRNRNRLTVTAALTPFDTLSFTGSLAAGKDDYIESVFGLRDNSHRIYSGGLDYAPDELFGAGITYSYERYAALSRSRQANPGPQFDDPSRNWATDSTDWAHSIIAHYERLAIANDWDVYLKLDYNRAKARYVYLTGPVADRTLPEAVGIPSSLDPPTQLPATRSELLQTSMDLIYWFSDRWRLGTMLVFERYDVDDFSLGIEAAENVQAARAVLLGYHYEPYTAATVSFRALYRF